jgi:hypothetical protein
MARIAHTLGVLACAVSLGAGAISVADAGDARAVSASASAVAVSKTAAENESAAQAEAASLLTQLPLPSGATESAIEPAEDDSLLAHPGFGPPATPNVVDDHAWWLVPGAPAEVLAYIRAHLPAGITRPFRDRLTGPNVPHNESEAFAWPPIVDVLAMRWLVVWAVQLPDGSTGLRVDAQVVWLTPRPATETIPPGGHLLRISVYGRLTGEQPMQRPLRVTSLKKINAIVTLLNALPAAQPGLRSCPIDRGIRVRLAFYARRGVPPLAVAVVDPEGCGGVALTIGGVPQPGLESGTLLEEVDHVLGVELSTRPRSHVTPPSRASTSESTTVTT